MIYLGQNAVGLNHMITSIGSAARIEGGSYTPLVDSIASEIHINHSLGVIPDFIIYYCDNFQASSSYTQGYLVCGMCYITNLSSVSTPGIRFCLRSKAGATNFSTSTGFILPEDFSTTNNFVIPYAANTDLLKANLTYHYILGKFKDQEVTVNA